MNVLMLSLDKTLLGEQAQGDFGIAGDTIERHRTYGAMINSLDILVTSPKGYEPVSLSEQVTVYPSNARGVRGHFKAALNLARDIKNKKGLDLVVAQDLTAPAALLIRKKLGIPFIVTFHGADFESPEWHGSVKKEVILYLVKNTVRYADGLRVVSPAMKTYFESAGFNGEIVVIPTPSDFSIFQTPVDVSQTELSAYSEHIIILTDGRLESVKQYPVLFDAFVRLKKKYTLLKLVIIGSGSKEQELKELAIKKDISQDIVWVGKVLYEKLPAYYQQAHVFVLTSESESLGKVLLQAGAAAKPVVATKTLGAQGIVKDGETGLLAEIGNSQDIAQKISILLDDAGLRHKLGHAARDYVMSHYDSSVHSRRIIDFWQHIVANKKTHQ